MSRDSICSSKSCRLSWEEYLSAASWPSKDHLPRSSNSHEVLRYSLLTSARTKLSKVVQENPKRKQLCSLLIVVDNCMWLRNEEKSDKRFKTTTGKWYVLSIHIWGHQALGWYDSLLNYERPQKVPRFARKSVLDALYASKVAFRSVFPL